MPVFIACIDRSLQFEVFPLPALLEGELVSMWPFGESYNLYFQRTVYGSEIASFCIQVTKKGKGTFMPGYPRRRVSVILTSHQSTADGGY